MKCELCGCIWTKVKGSPHGYDHPLSLPDCPLSRYRWDIGGDLVGAINAAIRQAREEGDRNLPIMNTEAYRKVVARNTELEQWKKEAEARASKLEARLEKSEAKARAILLERPGPTADAYDAACVALAKSKARITELKRELADLKANNARLQEWKALMEAGPGESAEVIRQRMIQTDAIQPFIEAWKKENAALKAQLAEARNGAK